MTDCYAVETRQSAQSSSDASLGMTVMVMRVNRGVDKRWSRRRGSTRSICALALTLRELETAFQSLKFDEVSKEAADPKHLRGPKVACECVCRVGCVCVCACMSVCVCVPLRDLFE